MKSVTATLFIALFSILPAAYAAQAPERAFDIWDWTPPCRDLVTFRIWAEDLKRMGFTRLEISAPWNLLEPKEGEYDLSFIADRLAVARSLKMGLRVRINSYYAGATPSWLQCDHWRDGNGAEPIAIPSINDPRFWRHYGPLCTAIARRFRGEDILYSPFIGVHAELKWADWWTYDDSSLALWRKSIGEPRPAWLKRVVGNAPLPERPSNPQETHGTPDLAPASRAFIAFREECWREAVQRFVHAIHAGDAKGRVSVPLGESYRRQSAQMSNLDYFGLSRGAVQVVHSYDFFWHAEQDPWYAAATVAAFKGITGLPVSFEFDGPDTIGNSANAVDNMLRIADAAAGQGAGLKAANYSGSERLPSSWPFLVAMVKRGPKAPPTASPASKTILLFVSKWTNYCYREQTEWLHDAQFGAWKMLTARGLAVRFICEDNLSESLNGYRGVYVAFSPPDTMPAEDRLRLDRLCAQLPSIVETPGVPPIVKRSMPLKATGRLGTFPVIAADLPVAPCVVPASAGWKTAALWNSRPLLASKGRHVVLGYPLAYTWLKGENRAASQRVLEWAISRIVIRDLRPET